MKKLYKKGKVHPSPPTIAYHLGLLPATILTLTVALSAEDKEVLAYLISCSNTSTNFSIQNTHKSGGGGGGGVGVGGSGGDHPATFQCNCFRCYMSFWARWDASPNRQLIHEIIEAYEEELVQKKLKKSLKSKKERKKRVCDVLQDRDKSFEEGLTVDELGESESAEVSGGDGEVEVGGGGGEDGDEGLEKGSMRKILSFIGEKIWGAWNRV